MAFAEKYLGQARENSIDAVSVYSPASDVTAIIRTIMLANTSGNPATCRVFIDNDGSTYDETTALAWDIDVPLDTSLQIDGWFVMDNSLGNLAYSSSVANAITISVYGAEVS